MEDATTFLSAKRLAGNAGPMRCYSVAHAPLSATSADQILVWVPQAHTPEQLRLREDGYLRRFETEAQTRGQRYLLVESTEGLSINFRRRALGRIWSQYHRSFPVLRRTFQVGSQ